MNLEKVSDSKVEIPFPFNPFSYFWDFMVNSYDYISSEAFLDLFDDPSKFTLRQDVFQNLIKMIKGDKSPGSPLNFLYSSNKDAITNVLPEMRYEIERLLALSHLIGNWVHENRAYDLFNQVGTREFHDHVSVMLLKLGVPSVLLKTKGEPRLVGKDQRLICSVSVVMNTVWRVVINDGLETEGEHPEISTAVKLDIATDESRSHLYKEFESERPLESNDVSKYEYSITGRLRLICFFSRAYNMGLIDKNFSILPGKHRHYHTLLGVYFITVHRVVQTQSGELYTSRGGEMSSGELPTFSDNSRIRAYLSYLVKRTFEPNLSTKTYIKTAGDDCLDKNPVHYNVEYLKYGFTITDHFTQSGLYTFCSTSFTSKGAYQDSIEKFVVNCILLRCEGPQIYRERLAGFDVCYAHHPQALYFKSLLLKYAPG